MNPLSILSVIIVFILSGCMQRDETKQSEQLNTLLLNDMVVNAVGKDTAANYKLSNLIDFSLPVNNEFNKLTVDSILLKNKTILFYVLLEYPDPVYNRFAVYKPSLNPLLIDKSLNGNIFTEEIISDDFQFIKIDEVFLSKDTLQVNRLSIYGIDTAGVSLSLRTFTKLVKPDIEFSHVITELSDSLIVTKINSSRRSVIDNKEDRFIYNTNQKKYLSSENIFDNFVKSEIENFKYEVKGKELKE